MQVILQLTFEEIYGIIFEVLILEENMKNKKTSGLLSYLIITAGTIVMSAGIYFFKFPNNFSTGGVSALSMLLAAMVPGVTAGQFMMYTNILLLIVGFLFFGRKFAIKTVYSSLLLSFCTRFFEVKFPLASPLTDQTFLELVFAIGLIAVGSAIIFNENASTGGTDIIAMIIKKYSSMNIGRALLCSDFVLASAGFFVFGIETGLYSVLGLVFKAFVVDNIIDGINLSKCFIIITDNNLEVCSYINNELHRGATISACEGAFSNTDKKMIITVLNRMQAVQLKLYLREHDPHAFTVITNSSDIVGKGFRTVM